jgi:hypothetical protein
MEDVWGVDANQIYAAGSNSIFFSSGNGNWNVEFTTGPASRVNAVWGANSNAIYACTNDGLFYRSNGQGLWSEPQEFEPGDNPGCFGIWGTSEDNIYLATSEGVYHGTR